MAGKRKPPYCPSCGTLDIKNFYVDSLGRRAQIHCKECHKQRCKARWEAMTPMERKASRASTYGITPQQFLELYDAQAGKCAICDEVPTAGRGLHIDHCHTTKQVRGLLCHGCNTGIGAMKESAKTLRSAIKYLGG